MVAEATNNCKDGDMSSKYFDKLYEIGYTIQ